MDKLLEKSRMINRLLQRTGGRPVDFAEMAMVLRDAIECNVYIASSEGKIYGYSLLDDFECDIMEEKIVSEGVLPGGYQELTKNHINTVHYGMSFFDALVEVEKWEG